MWILLKQRDSEWQRHQLGHMQVCISLQTDNHASTPPLSFFTGRMPFLPPKQQRQSTIFLFFFQIMFLLPSVVWHCWSSSRKGIRPVENWVVGCWHGYLSGVRCRLAYGPADATATHRLFASVISRLVLPFWYPLTRVVLDKGPLNGCVCNSNGTTDISCIWVMLTSK